MIKVVIKVAATQKTREKFIELRAENISFDKIAKQLKVSKYSGRAEALSFEPILSIADWLINNPEPDWSLRLADAAQTPYIQSYSY